MLGNNATSFLFPVIIRSDMAGEIDLSDREREILKLVETGASN